jgi:hypothetical protein
MRHEALPILVVMAALLAILLIGAAVAAPLVV